MAAAKKPQSAHSLERNAELIRKNLVGSQKDDLFKIAVEAGYLVALSDGQEDANERAALVKTIETLSAGIVIEWEVESLLAEAWARISTEGVDARAAAVGARLKELGAVEAGLLLAALVANATAGIDANEQATLEKIGTAAGAPKSVVASVVSRAKS